MEKYQLKMMSGDEFTISKEEAQLFVGKSGLIPVPSLGGMINISSISHILPVEKVKSNRKQNRDGQWCIKKFGIWVLENNPDVRVDLKYYPELKEAKEIDTDRMIETPSECSKYSKDLLTN